MPSTTVRRAATVLSGLALVAGPVAAFASNHGPVDQVITTVEQTRDEVRDEVRDSFVGNLLDQTTGNLLEQGPGNLLTPGDGNLLAPGDDTTEERDGGPVTTLRERAEEAVDTVRDQVPGNLLDNPAQTVRDTVPGNLLEQVPGNLLGEDGGPLG